MVEQVKSRTIVAEDNVLIVDFQPFQPAGQPSRLPRYECRAVHLAFQQHDPTGVVSVETNFAEFATEAEYVQLLADAAARLFRYVADYKAAMRGDEPDPGA